MKFRGNFVLKPEALAECARAEVLRVADEEDRAKPQSDRLVCAGHRRNRLQYVKSGLAIATTPAEAARSLLPFRSVVASPAFRACRSLGPPDRFQSTQADPFCLLGAFGFRTFPAQSDGIGEFQPIQIIVPHRGSATRSFLRFLTWRGVAPSGLDRAIPRIRRARHASLPTHLSSEQLARLLQRPAALGPAAYRDLAILSLRAGEAAALELDDLDWRAGRLSLRAGKSRRERVLPLPQEVGAALAEYLRHGRPRHRNRRVFLTLTDPARTFQAAAVSAIVRRNLVRAGIALGRLTGAHMLRHTAASRMVNGGAGLKEVADVLGHRSLQTTGIYAKLDIDALAGVALPWTGGGR
jgi:site-specific recombinase XerD